MKEWPLVRLDSVCDVIDPHPSHRAPERTESGVPFAGIGDFDESGKLLIAQARVVDREILTEHRQRYRIEDGLLAFGRVASIGKTIELPTDNTEYAISPTFAVLRVRKELALRRFIFWLLQSPQIVERAILMAKGSTRLSVGIKDLRRLQVPLPPLDEQKRIVAKLDEVKDHVTSLESALEAKLVHQEALERAVLGSFLEPDPSWISAKLGDLAEIFDGPHATPNKTSEGPWYLSIASLRNGQVDLSKSAHLSETDFAAWTKRTEVRQGDTLFSYETRLGQAGLWETSERAALGRRMGLLRPNDLVEPAFLTLLYLGPAFQAEITQRISKGATVDRIPIKHMGEWPVVLPPLKRQREILDSIKRLKATVQANLSRTKKMQELSDQLRKSFLTSLLTDAA